MAEEKSREVISRLTRVVNSDRPTFYANNAFVYSNQWDVQLYFGILRETDEEKFQAVDQVLVIMTPEHALALMKALERNLKGFEERQGPIRDVRKVEAEAKAKKEEK